MTPNGVLQIAGYFLVVLLLTKPLGSYMARVFQGESTFLSPVLQPIERAFYRFLGIDPDEDMRWTTYAYALLMFSVAGGALTYALLRFQGHLPLNPEHFNGTQMPPDLAFNTSMSFATNTDWQNYVPELTTSYFSNMVALAIHNWMSAATGIAVAIGIVRGFARRSAAGLGSFWVDMTRSTLYILLPACLVYAIFLVDQGVPQNFAPYIRATTVEGSTQSIAQGPVASQECIKMLGTNGGGFFNANSAHPYENPTPLTNFVQMVSLLCIGAALTYTFGKMVGNQRQGWALFAAMAFMFAGGVSLCYWAEAGGNPNVGKLGVMTAHTGGWRAQPGGNMEGKEVRFGITDSALFATVTTDASCGAVNSMHDSYTPLGGMAPLLNILCDETIFGGVGAGLFGMLMYAIVAVFIAGLMVGRTPEYVGKKIEKLEVRMAVLAVLILFANVVVWTALTDNLVFPPGENSETFSSQQKADEARLLQAQPTAAWNTYRGIAYGGSDTAYGSAWNNVANPGPHGFSEIFYQYASQTGNNGSAFAGLTGNTPYYNATGGLAMLIGRFFMIIPLLALAGSLARKKPVAASAGTLATDSATFAILLAFVVLMVGALEYFPALSLGPIVEHFQMLHGTLT